MRRALSIFQQVSSLAPGVAALLTAACAVSQPAQPPIHDPGSRDVLVAAAAATPDTPAPAAAGQTAKPSRPTDSDKPSFERIRSRISSTTETVPLAKIGERIVTNQTVRYWLEVPGVFVTLPAQRRPATADEVLNLPAKDLAELVSTLALYEMASQEALHATDFVSTRLATILEARKRDLLRSRFIELQVEKKNPPMGDEEARQWYEKNLHTYTEPITFSAYSIFLSTYRPYAMKKNDTLDGLAQRFLGDTGKFGRILDPETKKPVSDLINLRPFLPFAPPSEGRVVLIPIVDEEKRAVRRRMDQILSELRDGADFVQLAQKYSEDEPTKRGYLVGPLPAPGRPILPTVLDAAMSTTPGMVTPVLETPHGYVVLKIVDKQDRSAKPYEEVRDELIAAEVKRRRQKARNDLYDGLFKDPMLRIDRKALMTDGAAAGMVIARVGDFEYTWGDYRRDTRRQYSAPERYEDRVELLKRSARLRQAIVDEKIAQLGLDKDPVAVGRIDANETVFRGKEYYDWYMEEGIKVTEQQLRAFYDENRKEFREPGRYRVRELIIKLKAEEMRSRKRLEAMALYLRNDVKPALKSEGRFVDRARALGNWPEKKRDRGDLKTVEELYRGPEFAKTLAELEPGRTHGPFQAGDEMFLLWLDGRSKRSYRQFGAARKSVEALYRKTRRAELAEKAEKEIRSRHKLEYLFAWEQGGKKDGASASK